MSDNNLDIIEKVFGEKLENVEYIDRIGIYGIVINRDGKVATIKTSNGYFLPGGGIENSENHEQCLKREFIEETGYDIEIGKYIGKSSLYHISKTHQYLNGIGYFYYVTLKSKIIMEIEEDHELLWIEPMQCINYLFLQHQSWAVSKALGYHLD